MVCDNMKERETVSEGAELHDIEKAGGRELRQRVSGGQTVGAQLPRPHGSGALALGAIAAGAFALAAFAIGALAVGRLAIGRLVVGRSRIGKLQVEELEVKRLRVSELQVTETLPETASRNG